MEAALRERIDRALIGVEAMTREDCLETAAFARKAARRMERPKQREILEEVAVWYEQQAATGAPSR